MQNVETKESLVERAEMLRKICENIETMTNGICAPGKTQLSYIKEMTSAEGGNDPAVPLYYLHKLYDPEFTGRKDKSMPFVYKSGEELRDFLHPDKSVKAKDIKCDIPSICEKLDVQGVD